MPLRFLPIFVMLACAQPGLYLVIRALFFPRPEQLPIYGYLVRNGVQLGHATRYFVAYPILSWTILSIPMVTTRYTMGQFREGRAQLYVHRGMGTVGAVPLRLGSRPELALLTLRGS